MKYVPLMAALLLFLVACQSPNDQAAPGGDSVAGPDSPNQPSGNEAVQAEGVRIAVTNDVKVGLDSEGFLDQRVTEEIFVLFADGTATDNLAEAQNLTTSSDFGWTIDDQLTLTGSDGNVETFDNFALVDPAPVGATYEGCWKFGDIVPGARLSSRYCFDHSGNLAAQRLNAATDGEPAEAVAGEEVIRAGSYAVDGLSITFTYEDGETETRSFVPVEEDGVFEVLVIGGARYLKSR